MGKKKLIKQLKKMMKHLAKEEVKSQDARSCFDCGVTGVEFHKHHVVPKSKGGLGTVDLCLDCHSAVHGREISSSQLVKDAIAKVRDQGGTWGGDAERMASMRERSHEVRHQKCLEFLLDMMQATAFIELLHPCPSKVTQEEIIEGFNKMNFKTPRGKDWTRSYYSQQIAKVREYEEELQQLRESKHPEEETQWLN